MQKRTATDLAVVVETQQLLTRHLHLHQMGVLKHLHQMRENLLRLDQMTLPVSGLRIGGRNGQGKMRSDSID